MTPHPLRLPAGAGLFLPTEWGSPHEQQRQDRRYSLLLEIDVPGERLVTIMNRQRHATSLGPPP
jgi:hypothetical protein